MKYNINNKKGVAVFVPLISVAIVLLIFYVILYLPFFNSLRATVNYFLMIIFWILLQIFIIYGYFKLGEFSLKGFNAIKYKIAKLHIQVEKYIISSR